MKRDSTQKNVWEENLKAESRPGQEPVQLEEGGRQHEPMYTSE